MSKTLENKTNFFLETHYFGKPSVYMLLVLQKGHRVHEVRTGEVGLRLQGKHQTKSHHRQSRRRRGQITSEVRTVTKTIERKYRFQIVLG